MKQSIYLEIAIYIYKNMCFCTFFKEAYTYVHMKRYVPIVIGVVALCAVLYVANSQMAKRNASAVDESELAMMTSFTGNVTRNFEGENLLEYGFDLPEGATTTIEKDGALIKVTDVVAKPLFEMYFSFEGGRGYSPTDYITKVIAPQVKVINSQGVVAVGSREWEVVESERSVWRVAKSDDGQWLLVVESRKADAETVDPIVGSIVTQ